MTDRWCMAHSFWFSTQKLYKKCQSTSKSEEVAFSINVLVVYFWWKADFKHFSLHYKQKNKWCQIEQCKPRGFILISSNFAFKLSWFFFFGVLLMLRNPSSACSNKTVLGYRKKAKWESIKCFFVASILLLVFSFDCRDISIIEVSWINMAHAERRKVCSAF